MAIWRMRGLAGRVALVSATMRTLYRLMSSLIRLFQLSPRRLSTRPIVTYATVDDDDDDDAIAPSDILL